MNTSERKLVTAFNELARAINRQTLAARMRETIEKFQPGRLGVTKEELMAMYRTMTKPEIKH